MTCFAPLEPSALRRRGPATWWIALIVYSVYALALFHRALFTDEGLFWHDVSIAYLPLRTAAAEAIGDGHLPLWESRMGNGFPVLAEGQAGVFYPPNWLGYVGLPQYRVYAILITVHCILAALGTALFCRLLAPRMRLVPCLTAGMVYGFSGFFVTHVLHLTIVEAAAWLPVVLYCVERWLREPRAYSWLAGGAGALGMQGLVAMPQVLFYSTLTVVLYLVVAALSSERPEGSSRTGWVARAVRVGAGGLSLLAGALVLCAVQLWPTAALARESARREVTAQKLRELALSPRNLAYFVHPYILGSYAEGNYAGRDHYYEVCGFVGTIALLFGAVGAVHGRGRVWVFALLLVPLALFMGLANQNPLYEVLPRIPGFSFFRGAGRYVLLSSLGLAVLTAYGLQLAGESRGAVRTGLVISVLAVALCAGVPLTFRALRGPVVSRLELLVSSAAGTPEARRAEAETKYDELAWRLSLSDPTYLLVCLCVVATLGSCALGLGTRLDRRYIGELALALTTVQLFLFGYGCNPTIDARYYREPPGLARALKAQAGDCVYVCDQEGLQAAVTGNRGWASGDLTYYWNERELLRPNRQVLYGLRSANVFYALVPERYWKLTRLLDQSLLSGLGANRRASMQNPRAVLSALGARVVCLAQRDVLTDLPVMADYESWVARRNDDVAPLAYFARGVQACSSPDEALALMGAAGFDWRVPVVEGLEATQPPPTAGDSTPARVDSVVNDHGHVTVKCRTHGSGFLVVRETWDAHFRCLVDGRPTPVWRTNYLFRGVQLGPGEHVVEFVYDAWEMRWGLVLSCLAFAILMWVALACRGRAGDRGGP